MNHRQAVRDPQLSQLVNKALQQKEDFVNQIRQILG
jgi:outer membrane protein TolC